MSDIDSPTTAVNNAGDNEKTPIKHKARSSAAQKTSEESQAILKEMGFDDSSVTPGRRRTRAATRGEVYTPPPKRQRRSTGSTPPSSGGRGKRKIEVTPEKPEAEKEIEVPASGKEEPEIVKCDEMAESKGKDVQSRPSKKTDNIKLAEKETIEPMEVDEEIPVENVTTKDVPKTKQKELPAENTSNDLPKMAQNESTVKKDLLKVVHSESKTKDSPKVVQADSMVKKDSPKIVQTESTAKKESPKVVQTESTSKQESSDLIQVDSRATKDLGTTKIDQVESTTKKEIPKVLPTENATKIESPKTISLESPVKELPKSVPVGSILKDCSKTISDESTATNLTKSLATKYSEDSPKKIIKENETPNEDSSPSTAAINVQKKSECLTVMVKPDCLAVMVHPDYKNKTIEKVSDNGIEDKSEKKLMQSNDSNANQCENKLPVIAKTVAPVIPLAQSKSNGSSVFSNSNNSTLDSTNAVDGTPKSDNNSHTPTIVE